MEIIVEKIQGFRMFEPSAKQADFVDFQKIGWKTKKGTPCDVPFFQSKNLLEKPD
jgi:hypothetical protein